jgi:tetratricopeptide (TPR) repeat protein
MMLRKLSLLLAIALVAVLLHALRWQNVRRNRRRRQALIADGVATPRSTKRWEHARRYLRILPVIPLVAAMFYFQPRLKRMFSPPWDQVILFGGVFVVAFIGALLWAIFSRDRAVTAALRTHRAGDADRAIDMLAAAIRESPTAMRHSALGTIYSQEQRWEEAYKSFEQARALAPDQPIHFVNCAITLSELKRSGEAIALTQAGRAQFPFDAGVQLAEAIVLARAGRHDEAAERVRQATEFERVAPDNQRVNFVTRGQLKNVARELVQASASRGFQVTAIVSQAPASDDATGG